jgi:hypothetical protein
MQIPGAEQTNVIGDALPVNMDSAQVLEEVRRIVSLIDPDYDITLVEMLHAGVERLFRGEYPGFRPCNTEYHDLQHTMDTLLAMARLMHGASTQGVVLSERGVILGLASALFHDTGYIQYMNDATGTGAKYTLIHISRSIEFAGRYLREHGRSEEDAVFCGNCLFCTGFSTKIEEIPFQSEEERLAGWMLGSADLLGQMADRTYLEKLLFLFREFQEGNIPGFGSERDLLQNTLGFYHTTKRKLADELGNIQRYMRPHFAARWNLDIDLYDDSIRRNMEYLEWMIRNSGDRYRDHLRRGGLVRKLQQQYI